MPATLATKPITPSKLAEELKWIVARTAHCEGVWESERALTYDELREIRLAATLCLEAHMAKADAVEEESEVA